MEDDRVTWAEWATGLRQLGRSVAAGDVRAAGGLTRVAMGRLARRPLASHISSFALHPGAVDRGGPSISPITEVPYPRIDLSGSDDPIADVVSAAEFEASVDFFARSEAASRALLSANAQALLYTLARNLGADDVVEIGTYQASTSEAIARALLANAHGTLHTVDPFGANLVPEILERWPTPLRAHVAFYPEDSMWFFARATQRGIRPSLVLIDGNHDYEFALFDIESSARIVRPGGFIAVDSIGQVGPFFAVRDFLDRQKSWRVHGDSRPNLRPARPFDLQRSAIENTDLCILRAPSYFAVDRRPVTTGEQPWTSEAVPSGLSVSVPHAVRGTLYVQLVLRSFGDPPAETTVEGKARFEDSGGELTIPVPTEWFAPSAIRRTVEPWLVWDGDGELKLAKTPQVC